MILIVCGSRTWTDEERIYDVLGNYLHDNYGDLTIVEGGARGADSIAADWAIANEVELVEVKADWDRYGNQAGRIRNLEMLVRALTLSDDDPVAVLAFYKGKFSAGTQMMINYCERFGIPVEVIREA